MAREATERMLNLDREIETAMNFLGFPSSPEDGILSLSAEQRREWAEVVAALVAEHGDRYAADLAYRSADRSPAFRERALARYQAEDLPHLQKFAAWVARHAEV